MTTKSEFNAEEWETVTQAPALGALMVMIADRGGAIRESIALGKAYNEARQNGGTELVQEVVSSPPRLDPTSIGPRDHAREQLPQRLTEAVRLVEQKATPDEADSYKRFVMTVAQAAAAAHKEGGFLGIGGKQVSAAEEQALDEISITLGAPPAS
jgi:hypothetical protein